MAVTLMRCISVSASAAFWASSLASSSAIWAFSASRSAVCSERSWTVAGSEKKGKGEEKTYKKIFKLGEEEEREQRREVKEKDDRYENRFTKRREVEGGMYKNTKRARKIDGGERGDSERHLREREFVNDK